MTSFKIAVSSEVAAEDFLASAKADYGLVGQATGAEDKNWYGVELTGTLDQAKEFAIDWSGNLEDFEDSFGKLS